MTGLFASLDQLKTAAANLRSAVNDANQGWNDQKYTQFVEQHITQIQQTTEACGTQMGQLLETLARSTEALP